MAPKRLHWITELERWLEPFLARLGDKARRRMCDPTADPSKAWPEDRRAVEVGTLTVQQIQAERDGPCRDINFDPTVVPAGIRTSDDPFPAARSSAYAKSYDRRTAEAEDYSRTATGANPRSSASASRCPPLRTRPTRYPPTRRFRASISSTPIRTWMRR